MIAFAYVAGGLLVLPLALIAHVALSRRPPRYILTRDRNWTTTEATAQRPGLTQMLARRADG